MPRAFITCTTWWPRSNKLNAEKSSNDLQQINPHIIRGDLALKDGPVLVPVKQVESLLELLNLLIRELVKASCHACNWEEVFSKRWFLNYSTSLPDEPNTGMTKRQIFLQSGPTVESLMEISEQPWILYGTRDEPPCTDLREQFNWILCGSELSIGCG